MTVSPLNTTISSVLLFLLCSFCVSLPFGSPALRPSYNFLSILHHFHRCRARLVTDFMHHAMVHLFLLYNMMHGKVGVCCLSEDAETVASRVTPGSAAWMSRQRETVRCGDL